MNESANLEIFFRETLPALAVLALCLLEPGCVTSPKLESELSAPPPGTSVVLVRLTVTVDGKPADPFAQRTEFHFTIVNRDAAQTPRLIRAVPVQGQQFRK